MKRKDLTPAGELALDIYNKANGQKIKLEDVKHICIANGEIVIEYNNLNAPLGYDLHTMNIEMTDEEVEEYNHEQYHRAIELAVQAVHDNNVSLFRWLSIQEIYSLQEIYHSYGDLLDDCVSSIVRKVSRGFIEVDTAYEKIFCIGDYVSFHDLEGTKYKLKFAWFLSPELTELKEYFANYKKVNRLQQIDKCKDDIERYKKWILESEETLKKLEEEEELL